LIYIKELIVVLGLSIPLFAALRHTALIFMDEADFNRRRNVWLILTCTAFLSPSFWLFAAVATPLLYWGGRKDTNPIAFYLFLLNVIPSITIPIPSFLVQELFDLDILRLLSLCVLVPAALRIRKSRHLDPNARLTGMDYALLGFGILQVFLFIPPDLPNGVILQNSYTNDLRSAFLFLIDTYVVYYVASRSVTDRRKLLDAMAAFCLSCCLMALIAIFESVKHWLLYTNLTQHWGGDPMLSEYYFRGPFLRAQASSGQPLALGFLLVIGMGFWLYLRTVLKSKGARIGITVLLCGGLLVSFSRGPWLAAIVTYLAYAVFGPRGWSRLFQAAFILLFIGGAVLVSPIGDKISSIIPFMGGGQEAASTLTYRQQLFARSWDLIKARPALGDQQALSKMKGLRQGQGIIDLTNTYIQVTLFYGFVGLTLFFWYILYGLSKARGAAKRWRRRSQPDLALLGACITACIIGSLVLFADVSLEGCTECLFYVFTAFAIPYARLGTSAERDSLQTAAAANTISGSLPDGSGAGAP
jgi:hypothetical protein